MRKLKEIKLTDCLVLIPEELTWGEYNQIQKINMSNITDQGLDFNKNQTADNVSIPKGFDYVKFVDSKYKILEVVIKEIKVGDEKQEYSDEFVNNLSFSDGELLYKEVNNIMPKNIDKDKEIKKKSDGGNN